MPRFTFLLACCLAATTVGAQQMPGRDLLDFPVGTLAEPAALASLTGDGLWNPAAIDLANGARARFSAASLHTSASEGVTSQLISVGARVTSTTTVALGAVRATVSDIFRTDTDPQALGPEIPYSAMVLSATVSQRHEGIVLGLATRYRIGELDETRRTAVGLDAGARVDDFLHRGVRVAAATYLWRPAGARGDQSSFNLAADVRVAGDTAAREARLGIAYTDGVRRPREIYAFASGQLGVVQGRAGVARSQAYGHSDWRMRVGLGIQYARYVIGIAREENDSGRAPVYQFTLTALIP